MKLNFQIYLFLILGVIKMSCVQFDSQHNNKLTAEYSSDYNKVFNISSAPKTSSGYIQLVIDGLDLDSLRSVELKNIILNYESEKIELQKGSKELKNLTKKREQNLERLLNPIELKQLRFIRLRYYNFPLKNPQQVTNIQKTVGMSDGEVLKYIEIVERFRSRGDKPVMNQRLNQLLGVKYDKLVQAGIFYK